MALALADRCKETTASSGLGTFSLAGAVAGFQSFVTGIGTTNTTYYSAFDPISLAWETGIGTVTAGTPNTLSRTTVLASSTGAKINFANSPIVWCDITASKAVVLDSAGNLTLPAALTVTGQIIGGGTATNDNAAAGKIGEYISSNISRGAGPSLTSDVTGNITSISLAAGDWDLTGLLAVTGGAFTAISGGISLVSATTAPFPGNGLSALLQYASPNDMTIMVSGRLSLAATTTVFLVVNGTSVAPLTGYGFIGARRAR
jgi:hypothetical protein